MLASQKGFASATMALIGFTVIVAGWFFWNNKLSDIDKAARDLAAEMQNSPIKDQTKNIVSPTSSADSLDPGKNDKIPVVLTNNRDKIKPHIPAGWETIKETEGDLNSDGLLDMVVVAEDRRSSQNKCMAENCTRILLVLFGNKSGGFDLSLRSERAVLLADEGGIFGDPFEGLSIKNGVLFVDFYGGSAWRWSKEYKFQYQKGGWYMIGKAIHDYHNACPYQIFKSEDYNYLTGVMEKTTGDGWDKEQEFECDPSLRVESGRKESINMGQKELLNLRDFDPRKN